MKWSKELDLLGRHDCLRLGLIAKVGAVSKAENSACKIQFSDNLRNSKIEAEVSDVLGDKIGCIAGEYEIKLEENVTPVVHPPRFAPARIRESVKTELGRLERYHIISKETEPTD